MEALAAAARESDVGAAPAGAAVYRVRVLRVEPSQGWPSSSKQLVTVDVDASALAELSAVASVSCAWGNASSTAGALAAPQSGSGSGLMRVRCAVPEQSPLLGGGAGAVSLEVSMLLADGGRATSESGLAFWFEEPVVVVSALPSAAPAAAAVTVTVTGAGFRNTAALSCRVGRGASAGGDASTAAVAASARWLSATAVECVLPARAGGNATLHVSNDGVVYSAAGARLEALAVAALESDAGLAAARTAVYVMRALRIRDVSFVAWSSTPRFQNSAYSSPNAAARPG